MDKDRHHAETQWPQILLFPVEAVGGSQSAVPPGGHGSWEPTSLWALDLWGDKDMEDMA